MYKVYIAGPYTEGDTILNVRAAIDAANRLVEFGCAPFVPHLFHFWHLVHPQNYHTWMDIDIEWLKQCDMLLRLSGPSKGSEQEVDLARQCGIAVYTSIEELCGFLKKEIEDGEKEC